MTVHKPVRFGAIGAAGSREAWADLARKVEALGYATFLAGEHPAMGGLGPLTALMAAADATTTLRLGTHVLANDFRHPVLLPRRWRRSICSRAGASSWALGRAGGTPTTQALGSVSIRRVCG